MTAATAPYAIEMGLVVHLFNLNTNKTIDMEVPVKDGRFNNEGNCSIAGVAVQRTARRIMDGTLYIRK